MILFGQDYYRSRLGCTPNAHFLPVGVKMKYYLVSSPVTIRPRYKRRLFVGILRSLVHESSTCRCFWSWSTFSSWGTSWRQRLFTSSIVPRWQWAIVNLGDELSRQSASTCLWLLLHQFAAQSLNVHGRWGVVCPWLFFKAGFTVAKSSELFDCCGFVHRTFAFHSADFDGSCSSRTRPFFSNSEAIVREFQIFLQPYLNLK